MMKAKQIRNRRDPNVKQKIIKAAWSFDENSDVRDALAVELIGVCMATLKRHGFTRTRLSTLVTRAVTDEQKCIPAATKVLSDMWRLGELGSKWAQDNDYLDTSGRPMVLDIRGRGRTLQSLAREFFGPRAVEEVVAMGCKTRVMHRIGKGKVAHFGGCVMFTSDPVLILAHSVRSARWFLDTSAFNHRTLKRGVNVLPDRAAYAVVPKEDLADFVKMMRVQISALIEMGDRWLTARAELKRGRRVGKKVTMGIQAFVFQDGA